MTKRIETVFESVKVQGRAALVTFIMANDPDFESSLEVLKGLPGAGADIIELGMPFSDPVADGAVIQLAGQRALKSGGSMKRTLAMAEAFRKENDTTPLILMGYANPLYAYGLEAFARDAAKAGIDGLIVVDLPPEEDHELQKAVQGLGISVIRLVTPTTDEARLPKLLNGAGGFLYYVSIAGVTGAARADLGKITPHISWIKGQTDLPVAIGFGIKTADDAQEMAAIGDAVVVGSSIVQKIAQMDVSAPDASPVLGYVDGLAAALKRSL
ncbi:MAG: tryptophan synthase subunit alpha [Alphaproteobacteria bacterium]|nr:tryptophan synthase subunit alpha [Alphaproteobacteria bacterium]